eukprot:TRINITY_DN5463_c0_g3_i1.p2 TRINITY_DN5463_c0_g3~~TRINITY_DN5463_c0_g3_i1.p2  ORF type:complete len:372 (+),score=98.92 TRINITY_DN5463_c0_g3_i1:47-1162(+)
MDVRLAFVFLAVCAGAGAQRSLIMTADPGGFSGVSEGQYILSNMTNVQNISSELPRCADAFEGLLRGKPVVLVTTGIGTDNAALCSVTVLEYYQAKSVELIEAIYLGTSGWTPKHGGFYNPETDSTCTAPLRPTPEDLNNIGDICISSASFRYTCGFCEWDDFPNAECTAPSCMGRDQEDVFSKCTFISTDNSVSERLINASKQVQFQSQNTKLAGYVKNFWTQMWQGLGVSPPVYPLSTPRVHGISRCAETSDYTLWTGMPQDYLCRKYLAQVLGNATGSPMTPEQVTCVSAMEGPGWMQALLESSGKKIPFANIRGGSDYDFWPLVRNNFLVMNSSWMDADQVNDMVTEGYRYAVGTMTQVVLQYFETH